MGLSIRGIFNDTTLAILTIPMTPGEVRITPNRALHVNLRNQAGVEFGTAGNPVFTSSGGSGGLSIIDEAVWAAGVSTFTPTGGAFNDTAQALTTGQQGTVRLTANRALQVNLRNAAGVEFGTVGNPVFTSSGGSGGLSITDAAAWTAGASTFTPTGGVFNDAATALTAGQQGTVRLTANRALQVNLRNVAGVELGTVGNPVFVSGGGAGLSVADGTTWTAGVTALAPTGGVFNDAAAALTSGTEGTVRLTANRALHANLRTAAGVEIGTTSGGINVAIVSGGGAGFSAADGAAWAAGVTALVPTGGVFNDAAAALATGTEGTVRLTPNRAIHSNLRTQAGVEIGTTSGGLNVAIVSGGGAGFSAADGATWAAGVTALVPTGGVFNDAAAALATGTEGTVRLTANRGLHVSLRTQAGLELLGQKLMAGSIPVVIASDQGAVPVSGTVAISGTVPVSGTVTANQGTANATPWNANIAQFGGTAVTLGSKLSVSSMPVVIASDQGAVPVSGTVAISGTVPVSGTVTSNQGTANATPWNENLAQVGGAAFAQGIRLASNSLSITQASDNDFHTIGNIPSGTADSGNPVKVGGIAQTNVLPTSVASLARVNTFFDSLGREVVTLAPRLLKVDGNITLTASTAETTLLAGVVGTFLDLCQLVITNSSATATTITIRSGTAGTIKLIVDIAANGGAVINLPVPLAQVTANTTWTAQSSAAVSSIHIMAQAINNL